MDSSHINTESLYLANIETNDVTIDDALILENSQTITDTELSYLDGTSSNIESRFITDETNISQNVKDIFALEEKKTQNISATQINDISNSSSLVNCLPAQLFEWCWNMVLFQPYMDTW